MFFLEKRQSIRPNMPVTKEHSHLQLETTYSTEKKMRNQEPFHIRSASGGNFKKMARQNLIMRIRDIDVNKKVISAATNLGESRLFRRTYSFFRRQGWPF